MTRIEDGTEREGYYATWRWNALRKCWEHLIPIRVYPPAPEGEGEKFAASANEVWREGVFETFEDAERAAYGIEAKDESA